MHYDLQLFFRRNPFIKIALPFILGILFEDIVQLPFLWCLTISCISLLMYILFQQFSVSVRFYHAYASGVFLFLTILFSSATLHFSQQDAHDANHLTHHLNDSNAYVIELNQDIVITQKTYRTQGFVTAYYGRQKLTKIQGLCNLSILKKDTSFHFDLLKNYTIFVRKKPSPIVNGLNPHLFDAAAYYKRKQITHQLFIMPDEIEIIAITPKSNWQQMYINTRLFVLSQIQKYIPNKDVYGLLEALLIGYKQDLNKDILNEYLQSGTIHIIAISGLHLGCIYWFLAYIIFAFLKKNAFQKSIKIVLVLCGLWFYALLAGANASILRAAVMFSIIAIGEAVNKKSSLLNLLAFSAIFLLCNDTNQLYDLGFLLSYTAILGIALFNSFFARAFASKYKIIKWIVSILIPTIAAQILVFPVISYTNHIFSTYFIVNNLIAIPLSTIILSGTFLLLVLSPFFVIATYVGKTLSALVLLMNQTMSWSNDLPFALIPLPNFNAIEMLFYFFLLGSVIFYVLFQHRFIATIILLTCLLSAVLYHTYQCYQRQQQQQFIFYQNKNSNAFACINGRQADFYTDSLHQEKTESNLIAITNLLYDIEKVNVHKAKNNLALQCKQKSIVYFKQPIALNNQSLYCDYLIVNKGALESVFLQFYLLHFNRLVIDNSCTPKDLSVYAEMLKNKKVHYIKEDGAFIF